MAKSSYKEIEFTIKPDGTTEMDLQGFEGKGCHDVAEQFDNQISIKMTADQRSTIE